MSELTHDTPDDADKPRSLTSRGMLKNILRIIIWILLEREPTINVLETSSPMSFSAKLDDFFDGIFIPAAKAFENIREQIRVDHEKTWQGINPDNSTNDSPWPKQYAVLIQ